MGRGEPLPILIINTRPVTTRLSAFIRHDFIEINITLT